MTPLHRLCNPAPLRADIAYPGPGLYRLLRAATAAGGWIVVVDTAETRRQIGGR